MMTLTRNSRADRADRSSVVRTAAQLGRATAILALWLVVVAGVQGCSWIDRAVWGPPIVKPAADAAALDATAADAEADGTANDAVQQDGGVEGDAAQQDGTVEDSATTDAADAVADASADIDASADSATSSDADDAETSAPVGKVWNVLVDMAADNNLEKSGMLDLLQMASLSQSDNLVFHVQADRAVGFYEEGLATLTPWETTRRLKIQSGLITQLKDAGELNMGTKTSLSDFIAWGLGQVKADRTMLVLWNHGEGWRGFGGDVTDKDALSLPEFVSATAAGLAAAGQAKFDILGFDACLMGELPVLKPMSAFADILLASQDLEPENGWDYKSLQAVVDDPQIEPQALAAQITDDFREQCLDNGVAYSATLAALHATKLNAVHDAFQALAESLLAGLLDAAGKPDPQGGGAAAARACAGDGPEVRSLHEAVPRVSSGRPQ